VQDLEKIRQPTKEQKDDIEHSKNVMAYLKEGKDIRYRYDLALYGILGSVQVRGMEYEGNRLLEFVDASDSQAGCVLDQPEREGLQEKEEQVAVQDLPMDKRIPLKTLRPSDLMQEHGGEPLIPFSAALETRLREMSPEEQETYQKEEEVVSALPKIITTGFKYGSV